MFLELKRPPDVTGTYVQQFVQCGVVLDNYLEAFLFRMGETNDLRLLDNKVLQIVEDVKMRKIVPRRARAASGFDGRWQIRA
jgi:hypothetical protein